MTESPLEPESAAPPEVDGSEPANAPAEPRRGLRKLAMGAALAAVVIVNLVLISAPPSRLLVSPSVASSGSAPSSSNDAATPIEPESPPALVHAKHAAEAPETPLADDPNLAKPKIPSRFRTVKEAAARSCSTSSVDGLSRQIIAQARCVDPGAFVSMPRKKNLVAGPHVFLYFDRAARDELVEVLASHPDRTMKINSALRTVAQQYLLSRWATQKRCNIQLATPPGESNHETGLALDISDPSRWRPTLEAHGFRWLGKIDRVHFDYKGTTAASHTNVDVTAFQQLWNRNHPDDRIAENGEYSAETEQRLKAAPAGGFETGAACEKVAGAPAGGGPSSRVRAR